MTKLISIAFNAVTAKLHEPTKEVKLEVQVILTYKVQGAEHMPQFSVGGWDGRSSFFNFKQGTFPAGFVHYVSANLRRKGYTVNLIRNPLPEPQGVVRPKVDNFPEDPRYDYQYEVVDRLVKHGQIIAQIATGGGKSRIAKLAYARLMLPTLFLTTRGILMYQMKDSFERDFGTQVSVLGDGQFGHTVIKDGREVQSVKRMSVGMVQTLISRLEEKDVETEVKKVLDSIIAKEIKLKKAEEKRVINVGMYGADLKAHIAKFEAAQEKSREKINSIRARVAVKVHEHMQDRAKTIQLLGMFGLVILEEAHEASGNSYYDILKYCKNAHYRLALTGTPFMKSSEESNMRLMACSGPIAIKISEEMLIDRGILAQPHFKIINLSKKVPKLHRFTSWQSAYRIGITENPIRNQAIVDECSCFSKIGLTSMVLVQQVSHGEKLFAMLTEKGMRVDFIRGEDDQVERKTALNKLANNEIDVLIGTTILDVGVDVPAVGHICLAGGGKAEVALRQRIGRGLRAKKSGPNICFVTDFADFGNDNLALHAKQRLAIIKSTKGFDRFVYENGRDFDFAALGLETSAKCA